MPSASIQAFRRTVTLDWPANAADNAKAGLIRIARAGHAEIMAAQGNPAFEVYANTPGNRNIESVVLPGPIVYTYSNLRTLVEFVLDELHRASPVQSGDYVRSHMIFVNGLAVAALPPDIKPSDEIMIANPVPYARKLEIGKTKTGRDFVVQVPNRIYERVAKDKVMARYRNVARITFGYVTLPDSYRYRRDNAARTWLADKGRWYVQPGQRRDRVAGAAVRSPAIIIAPIQ